MFSPLLKFTFATRQIATKQTAHRQMEHSSKVLVFLHVFSHFEDAG